MAPIALTARLMSGFSVRGTRQDDCQLCRTEPGSRCHYGAGREIVSQPAIRGGGRPQLILRSTAGQLADQKTRGELERGAFPVIAVALGQDEET